MLKQIKLKADMINSNPRRLIVQKFRDLLSLVIAVVHPAGASRSPE